MKRTVAFEISEDKYLLTEEGVTIFSVDRSSLQFDVKSFYQAFFSDGKDYEDIEITGDPDLDKSSLHVLNTVTQLVSDICKKLNEDLGVANQNSGMAEGEADNN